MAILIVAYLIFNAATTSKDSVDEIIPDIKNSAISVAADGQNRAGEVMNVGLELDNISDFDIVGLEIDLSYDKDVFSEPEAIRTDILERASKSVSYKSAQEGLLKILVIGLNQNKIESGRVLDIFFKINPNAGHGQYSINIDKIIAVDPDAKAVEMSIKNGTIEIVK